jgi:phosphate starvation-inducible PhoH-like protein
MGKHNVKQPIPTPLSARNSDQLDLIRAIKRAPLVVASGEAGTGKTFVAMRMAAAALRSNLVSKIILTRPAVGGGEELGFLPGDIDEKMEPYLYEHIRLLKECFPNGEYGQLRKLDVIEIVPFEYMRSRTWDDAFIVLDEAQNTTYTQMKMFTTRIGERSKVVVCGDPGQTDLHPDLISGLEVLLEMSGKGYLPSVPVIEFDPDSVVRSEICKQFVVAWKSMEARHTPPYVVEYKRDEEDSENYEQDIYEMENIHYIN